MKSLKKLITLVLAAALCLGLVGGALADNLKGFTDAASVGEAYTEAMDVMVGIGVINGVTTTTLVPKGAYTRAQVAKIITYMLVGDTVADKLKPTTTGFKDVPSSHWASPYIAYCVSESILDGYGDGTFLPERSVTGYEFAKMLLCAVGYGQNKEFTGAAWYANVSSAALKLGVFTGDTSAAVSTAIERQQAVLMAFNTLTGVHTVTFSGGSYSLTGSSSATPEYLAENFDLTASFKTSSSGAVTYSTVLYSSSYGYYLKDANGSAIVRLPDATWEDVGRVGYVWYDASTSKNLAVTDVHFVDELIATRTDGAGVYTWCRATSSDYVGAAADSSVTYYINGELQSSTYTSYPLCKGDKAALYDSDGNGKVDKVIVTRKYADIIAATPTVNSTAGTVKIVGGNTLSFYGDSDYVSYPTGLAKGDVVLYWTAGGVTYIEKASSVYGRISAVSTTAGTAVIGGETYEISGNPVGDFSITTVNSAKGLYKTCYKDAYGYLLWIGSTDEVVAPLDFAYVLDYSYSWLNRTADLLLLDGTVLDNVAVSAAVSTDTFYSYTVSSSGAYTLTAIDKKTYTADYSLGYKFANSAVSGVITPAAKDYCYDLQRASQFLVYYTFGDDGVWTGTPVAKYASTATAFFYQYGTLKFNHYIGYYSAPVLGVGENTFNVLYKDGVALMVVATRGSNTIKDTSTTTVSSTVYGYCMDTLGTYAKFAVNGTVKTYSTSASLTPGQIYQLGLDVSGNLVKVTAATTETGKSTTSSDLASGAAVYDLTGYKSSANTVPAYTIASGETVTATRVLNSSGKAVAVFITQRTDDAFFITYGSSTSTFAVNGKVVQLAGTAALNAAPAFGTLTYTYTSGVISYGFASSSTNAGSGKVSKSGSDYMVGTQTIQTKFGTQTICTIYDVSGVTASTATGTAIPTGTLADGQTITYKYIESTDSMVYMQYIYITAK